MRQHHDMSGSDLEGPGIHPFGHKTLHAGMDGGQVDQADHVGIIPRLREPYASSGNQRNDLGAMRIRLQHKSKSIDEVYKDVTVPAPTSP